MAQRYATTDEVIGANGVAPELGKVTPGQLSIWMRIAERFVGLSAFGEFASEGHALASAHFLTKHSGPDSDGGGGEEFPLSGHADGPSSESFAVPTYDPLRTGDFGSTRYGRSFLALATTLAEPKVPVLARRRRRRG